MPSLKKGVRRVDLEVDDTPYRGKDQSIMFDDQTIWDKLKKDHGGVGSFDSGDWNAYGITPCWTLHWSKAKGQKLAMIVPGLGIMLDTHVNGQSGLNPVNAMIWMWTAMNIDLHWIIPTMVHCVYNYKDKKAFDKLPPSVQEIVKEAQGKMLADYKTWGRPTDPRLEAFQHVEKAITRRIQEEDYGY